MSRELLRKRLVLGFKFAGVLIVVAVLLRAIKYLNLSASLAIALEKIQSLGVWAPIAFICIYIFAALCLIPGSLLTLGAGVLFGVVFGSIYAFVGATLGAIAAFLVGRYLARGWVAQQIEGHAKFNAVDQAVAREGLKIVLLTRLSPAFPFVLLNYVFGITQVSLRDYGLGCLGMLPPTIMYVYIGSLLGDLATLTTGNMGRSRSPAELVFYSVGLVATVVVTIYVTQVAQKALDGISEGGTDVSAKR
ncbi:TVP38/TMEM64 family protein [Trichocoleus sp. FACHB-591]|uniref:TVP38/TMEM64 family protein n=1 Tax=Trichocoleus sp. FACHB-591 TaxID=2692872 RepID=UPI0016842F37|nr:TVP38/TMEM64 family protein [Trichocoleus sp. FACHB-591]MBD2096083.1 TVP38/TMEM64 family protein [Trichocoleus sp. FACHB-591]